MLKSEKPLVFVRAERNKGYSEKKQRDYDFATITVSDGLESLKINAVPDVATDCIQKYVKGDKIVLTVDVREENNRTNFIVNKVEKAS